MLLERLSSLLYRHLLLKPLPKIHKIESLAPFFITRRPSPPFTFPRDRSSSPRERILQLLSRELEIGHCYLQSKHQYRNRRAGLAVTRLLLVEHRQESTTLQFIQA